MREVSRTCLRRVSIVVDAHEKLYEACELRARMLKGNAPAAEDRDPSTSLQRMEAHRTALDDLARDVYKGKGLTEPVKAVEVSSQLLELEVYAVRYSFLQDKWELLPAFLAVKGLVKQHIDSFNHFVDVEIKQIVRSSHLFPRAALLTRWHRSKRIIESPLMSIPPFGSNTKTFWSDRSSTARSTFPHTRLQVGTPTRTDTNSLDKSIFPHECRLRDHTYSAPIFVKILYQRGTQKIRTGGIEIGRIPIMLRSNKCVAPVASVAEAETLDRCSLWKQDEKTLAQKQECPLDPGGYFIVKGTEKVILVQEQLSKNRYADSSTCMVRSENSAQDHRRDGCTRSTQGTAGQRDEVRPLRADGSALMPRSASLERKSKTYVTTKHKKIYLRHSSIHEEIPICMVLKACVLVRSFEQGR